MVARARTTPTSSASVAAWAEPAQPSRQAARGRLYDRRPRISGVGLDRPAFALAGRRIRPSRLARRGRAVVPDREVRAELDRDALQVLEGEVEAHAVPREIGLHRLVHDELELAELPRGSQDVLPVIGEHHARVEIVELGEERAVG